MNVVDFIFRLLHIRKRSTLFILTPLRSPCTPFANYAHLSTDYGNTFSDCTNFSIDCVNTPNDRKNIVVDSTDTLDISFVYFCIPNLALLQY
jgi:hypothetical protein